jgi:hypothetical protein
MLPSGSSPIPHPGGSSSLWGGLRSRFLEALSPDEQLRIFDLTVRTATPLYQWAAAYPLIRRVRVWPLALSVAAAARFSPVDALISTARLSLWVFTLDDLFDEEHVTEGELMRRAARYQAIARGENVNSGRDSLAAALREIRADLASYPLFAALGHLWTEALEGTISGMISEYRWRDAVRREGTAALPTYEEYVERGLYSIGGPPHVWAAVITSGDPSTPGHLAHLQRMERLACICIRLANDLQSYAKEVQEGNINAIVIRAHAAAAAGADPQQAVATAQQEVRQAISAGLRELDVLQAERQTETGYPEADIADIARFVCDFYTQYDYHTLDEALRQ